jgi:aliphatic sulfonates family ABC transporter substrate-binding protein
MPVLTLPHSGASSLSVRAKALVFEDERSQAVLSRIEQVAPSEATVLLTGETGTGKEIVARHIHQLSRRSSGPFVAVNCGAFSENLVESELFGHERGAFTGALQAKAGWFEAARGGTLFLDEVGDLPLSMQVKLLRVLQENEVVRVGSRTPIPINVRLVAATNVDLHEAMAAGHFREDLYYRLNVVSVSLPPLRERPGDIEALARYFCEVYERRLGVPRVELTQGALARLLAHPWPGNIRELENTVHHAVLVCRNHRIEADDIRVTAGVLAARASRAPSVPPSSGRADDALSRPSVSRDATASRPTDAGAAFHALEEAFVQLFEFGVENLHERIEETLMRSAYRYSEQNQLQTARLLGISRNVVRARLIQHGELNGTLRGSSALPSKRTESELVRAELGALRDPLGTEARGVEPRGSDPRGSSLARSYQSVVRIGYQKFGRLLLVKALGDLDRRLAERGVRAEWLEYPGGLQLVDALQASELDVGVVGECPPVFAQAAEAPIVYLASEASAPEAEAVIVPARSQIWSVRELRGRTVALNRGANVHYLLVQALEEVGLSYGDIEAVFLTPEEAESAFLQGKVDAWAIWDPLLGAVQRKSGARVLRDGRGLTQNTAYYVARRELAEREPEIVEEILAGVDRATVFAGAHLRRAATLLERESGMRRDALESWLTKLAPATRMNPAVVTAQQEIADRLYGLRIVPHAVRVADAQWSRSAIV